MKAIKQTVTSAQLNSGNEIEIDVTIPAVTGNYKYVPQDVLYVNGTGMTIGVIYLNSDEEKLERVANPTYYDFVPLDTGRSVGSLPSSIKYIVFKKITGTATADLTFYVTNYLQDY